MMPESTMQPSVPETIGARFDVVALVTSAGGLEALSTVLRALPSNLPSGISRATPQRAEEQPGRNPVPADNNSCDID